MDALLSSDMLSNLAYAKLTTVGFLIAGLFLIYHYKRWWLFLLLFGVANAASYYFLVHGTFLPFWGLVADEQTIAAMYQMFAHGSLVSDFAYAQLPPFYPPLWFQIFGLVGRLMDWNGVQIGKAAVAATMLFFPVFFYAIQRWYWRWTKHETWNMEHGAQNTQHNRNLPGKTSMFFSALALFILVPWDSIVTKPYELVSASLVVLWGVFLVHDLVFERLSFARAHWRRLCLYGICGGILFQLFYFWFFLFAIGILLFFLFTPTVGRRTKVYGMLGSVGVLTLFFAAPFWAPLAVSYAALGAEQWQLGFFVPEWIATHAPFFSFDVRGILTLVGLVSLIWFRSVGYMRILLAFVAAGYVWQAMGLVSLGFFSSPLQEVKGFLFFQDAAYALAIAFAIERSMGWLAHRCDTARLRSIGILGVVTLVPLLFGGVFLDDTKVLAVGSRANDIWLETRELIAFLDEHPANLAAMTLTSGLPELHAFHAFSEFIYFNQHNSHPAAHFSERLRFLRDLRFAATAEALHRRLAETPFGPIERLILYRGNREDAAYRFSFWVDAFPNGGKNDTVLLDAKLFQAPWFETEYENGAFTVLKPSQL